MPHLMEGRAGMALPTAARHTEERVHMARLAAAAPPMVSGRELTPPGRVPPLVMLMPMANGTRFEAPLGACAGMAQPQALGALAIRPVTPCAATILANLDGALLEARAHRGQASPRIESALCPRFPEHVRPQL